jgi:hypothetical protein
MKIFPSLDDEEDNKDFWNMITWSKSIK